MKKKEKRLLDSTIHIKINLETRNGVAISEKKAVTAVHGKYSVGQVMDIVNIHGHSKHGTINFVLYEASKHDIAVVELTDFDAFDHFIPFRTQPLEIDKELRIIGLRDVGNGEYTESVRRTAMEESIKDTSIFHATYYATEGLSGAGAVVTITEGGCCYVVGVYVGKHDDTDALSEEETPKKKRSKKQTWRSE